MEARNASGNWFNRLGIRFPRAEDAALVCILLFGFFICLSTALMNIFLTLALIIILFSGNLRRYAQTAGRSPVCISAVMLFVLLAVGTTWSVAEGADPYLVLNKYNELWYISMLLPLFTSPRRQRLAVNAFLFSMSLLLILVYAIYFGLVPELQVPKDGGVLHVTAEDPLGNDILVNVLMSYAMFILANRTLSARANMKYAYASLSLLAMHYSVFISSGTTGQITSICLILLFIVQIFRWKGILIFVLFLGSAVVYDRVVDGSALRFGVTKIIEGVEHYYGSTERGPDSVSVRLEFAHNSIKLFRKNPWIGTGTGSIARVYGNLPSEDISFGVTKNPHNEYLTFSIQLGLLGLLGLFALFVIQGASTMRIAHFEHRRLAQGLVVLIVVSCMGNSMILDSGEGHFWAYFTAVLFSGVRTDGDAHSPLRFFRSIRSFVARENWIMRRRAASAGTEE